MHEKKLRSTKKHSFTTKRTLFTHDKTKAKFSRLLSLFRYLALSLFPSVLVYRSLLFPSLIQSISLFTLRLGISLFSHPFFSLSFSLSSLLLFFLHLPLSLILFNSLFLSAFPSFTPSLLIPQLPAISLFLFIEIYWRPYRFGARTRLVDLSFSTSISAKEEG